MIVSSISYGQSVDVNHQDIEFYDSNACMVVGTGGGSLVGNDNAEKIIRYFAGKGLTIAQAAGISGNIRKESGYRSNVEQGGKIVDDSYQPKNGVGFGIVQWTSSGRQQGLVNLSKSSNIGITDLSIQLDYLWVELTGNYKSALDAIQSADNPVDAAIAFHDKYEKSADSDSVVRDVRGGFAQEDYNQFKDIVPDVNNNNIPGGELVCTNSGSASGFVNGFAIYNQNDRQWNSKPYGSSTIGEAGCGPSAMAMIITALGTTVTPVDTANYASGAGLFVDGKGSAHTIGPKTASHWGLNGSSISNSVAAVNNTLESGGLVLAVGTGSAPYTSYGHYIVIRANDGNGKWLIGDSNGAGGGMANSAKSWDPQDIISKTRAVWAITR